jgi:3-hydroxyisobutyrate dehydrogenase
VPTLRVAFLGLGAMGRPMASRLLESGFLVRTWNRTRREVPGATPCATPGECARTADVVVTMLADAEALAAVLEGKNGVLATFATEKRKPRPVLLDMSTIGRGAALAAARRADEHGARFVDAPVSGSLGPAARGELIALAGGSLKSIERVRPVLDALCKRVIHAGGAGQGQALKIVLNGVGAHHLVGWTSMLALGERAGLARDVLLDSFTAGAFATPSIAGKRDKLMVRDYAPDFSLALTAKDVSLAAALQQEHAMRLPVLEGILKEVEAGVREGLGDLDLFALEKRYAKQKSEG